MRGAPQLSRAGLRGPSSTTYLMRYETSLDYRDLRVRPISSWMGLRCCLPMGAAPPRRCSNRQPWRLQGVTPRARRCSGGDGSLRTRPCGFGNYETCMTIAAREVEVGRDAGALAVMA